MYVFLTLYIIMPVKRSVKPKIIKPPRRLSPIIEKLTNNIRPNIAKVINEAIITIG